MKKLLKLLLKLILAAVIAVAFMNLTVLLTTASRVISVEEAEEKSTDSVLVLGAAVWGNEPSPMLRQRIEKGMEVFNTSDAGCLLMSGDGRAKNYNEPSTMARYAIENGIEEQYVIQDPYGIRTYDSMWRAKYVLGYDSVIVITQAYHLNRAIYIGKAMGLEVYGVACDSGILNAGLYNNSREIVARCKDFIWCLLKLKPAYTE